MNNYQHSIDLADSKQNVTTSSETGTNGGTMPFVVLLLGLALVLIGAVAGRAFERNLWQQRLLAKAGLVDGGRELQHESAGRARVANGTGAHDVAERLDGMALEIERISEGQRFLTKLLAERDLPSARR